MKKNEAAGSKLESERGRESLETHHTHPGQAEGEDDCRVGSASAEAGKRQGRAERSGAGDEENDLNRTLALQNMASCHV